MELEKNKIKQSPTGATSLLSTEIESNLQNEQVQDQIPSSTIENGSGTAPNLRRVQSESDLKSYKTTTDTTQVNNSHDISSSANATPSYIIAEPDDPDFDRPLSKRRAFTFAGEDFDTNDYTSQTPGKDENDNNSNSLLTEENLRLSTIKNFQVPSTDNDNNISPRQFRSPSQSEWTWAWGTLPIKASDPSIADLQSLTDLALKEKFGMKYYHPQTPIMSPLAEGKVFIPENDRVENEINHLEFRQVPTEESKIPSSSPNKIIKNKSKNNSEDIEEQPNNLIDDQALPEPKYPDHHSQYHHNHSHSTELRPLRSSNLIISDDHSSNNNNHNHNLHTHILRDDHDDYRHTSASPRPGSPNQLSLTGDEYRETSNTPSLNLSSRSLSSSSLLSNNICARAASIASALGSERTLSLCAHILSSENPPKSEEELINLLKEYAVTPEEFSANSLDILNNPNLVVVVKNILIPWRLVHAHLTASPNKLQSDISTQEDLTVPANEKVNLWWAGRTVTNWGNWIHSEDSKTKLNEQLGVTSENMILNVPSVSRSVSVKSISNTDHKSDSRRNSCVNPDEEDFDHYECMSEGSSAGPPWATLLSSNPTLEDMDTPGAHLWTKETLNWNSADDFQRLLNRYTINDTVPDLLKPYVAYSNLWPTSNNDDDSSTNQSFEKDGIETPNKDDKVIKGISTSTSLKSATNTTIISSTSISISSSSPTTTITPNIPTLSNSQSHDTGLSLMLSKNNSDNKKQEEIKVFESTVGITSTSTTTTTTTTMIMSNTTTITATSMNVIIPDDKKVNINTTTGNNNGNNINSLIVEEKKYDPEVLAGNDDDNIEFLSLEDISPDEILPGPARGDYDGSDTDSFYSLNLDDENSSHASGVVGDSKVNSKDTNRKYRYRKTLVPTQEQIKSLDLTDGKNEITFEVEGSKVTAHIFVWPEDAKIVVADIEGALFVSGSGGGALGLMMSLWGTSASARKETHEGLAQLFDSIAANGYRFLYITTKPDTSQKEQLLKSSAKGSARYVGLPAGPVFLPPNALIQTISSERTDLFKAAALRGVRSLFPPQHNPYHAAFGANARDVRAFDRCEIPLGRTFLVSEKGDVTTMTTVTVKRTFNEMNSLLHQLFPAVVDSFSRSKLSLLAKSTPVVEDSFSDFNFWRLPPPPPPPLPKPSSSNLK
eukprot:CAMPEP_0174818958 /NCGR_PEP_ID=MMETSP1107-20130205/1920_1 /TAXON_ID=36770 /ORGANISM="Paraphysomonas vestita, Strain GFlagA" /LENGTH=1171 /DNA_ID=CAMNT_0016031619 /DNA_START=297 /DNA_END=3809 /DNA_ORIENTATION=-